jgi:hypothetical protein
MIIGTETATAAALCELQRHLRKPVVTIDAQQLGETPLSQEWGTLVIRGVGALNAVGQERLHGWLACAPGATQVVVTAAAPIFPCVERGNFPAELYYRLNIVYLEIGPPGN